MPHDQPSPLFSANASSSLPQHAPQPPAGRPTFDYTVWTSSARTCTVPRSTFAFSPHLPSYPYSAYDARAAPSLPTNSFSPTTRRHVPYQLRYCPHCPPSTLGDELHVILACPHRAPLCTPVISTLSHLLADYALTRAALTPLQQVSLIFASDPRLHLDGEDREQLIRELASLAASFAIALSNSLATS